MFGILKIVRGTPNGSPEGHFEAHGFSSTKWFKYIHTYIHMAMLE